MAAPATAPPTRSQVPSSMASRAFCPSLASNATRSNTPTKATSQASVCATGLQLLRPLLDQRAQLARSGRRHQDGGPEPHGRSTWAHSPRDPENREHQHQDRAHLVDPRKPGEELHRLILRRCAEPNQGLSARYDQRMALTPQFHRPRPRGPVPARAHQRSRGGGVRGERGALREGPRVGGDPVAALLEAQRHQEWFLYERASVTLGGVPSEKLLGAWREAVPEVEDPEELEVALLESQAGVYAVRQVGAGGEAWIQDLGNLAEHVLAANPEAPPLEVGDLLIGRIHPSRAGGVVASPAAGVFRSPELLGAVEEDLRARREQGGSARLRFDQASLEHAFYANPEPGASSEPAQPEQTEAKAALEAARAFLVEAGLEGTAIDDLFAACGQLPRSQALGRRDGGRAGRDPGPPRFRHRRGPHAARALWAPPGTLRLEVDVRKQQPDVTALADFDRGCAEGRDVQALLDDLERDLGLEGESDSEEDGLEPPVLTGVVEMLVTEFRWEQEAGMGNGPALTEAAQASLDHLSRFGAAFEQPEELDGEALRRLLFFWAPEQRLPAEDARALVEALDAFVPWAEAEHDLELASTWKQVRSGVAELERVLAMNAELPTVLDTGGELFEVLEAEDPLGLPGLLVSEEGMPARLAPHPEAFRAAQPGDLLRARRGRRTRGVHGLPGHRAGGLSKLLKNDGARAAAWLALRAAASAAHRHLDLGHERGHRHLGAAPRGSSPDGPGDFPVEPAHVGEQARVGAGHLGVGAPARRTPRSGRAGPRSAGEPERGAALRGTQARERSCSLGVAPGSS